jgi:UV DNA damage repair endonuclease
MPAPAPCCLCTHPHHLPVRARHSFIIWARRDCIKRTLEAKGLPLLGELALANCRDLAPIIQWNHEHGIRLFR